MPRTGRSQSGPGSIDLRRPGAWLLCILCSLALPCWLLGDELRHFCLAGDDFAYVADSRDASRLATNLFKPHNTHVVPLFRIWTFALVMAAGRLSNFATALALDRT